MAGRQRGDGRGPRVGKANVGPPRQLPGPRPHLQGVSSACCVQECFEGILSFEQRKREVKGQRRLQREVQERGPLCLDFLIDISFGSTGGRKQRKRERATPRQCGVRWVLHLWKQRARLSQLSQAQPRQGCSALCGRRRGGLHGPRHLRQGPGPRPRLGTEGRAEHSGVCGGDPGLGPAASLLHAREPWRPRRRPVRRIDSRGSAVCVRPALPWLCCGGQRGHRDCWKLGCLGSGGFYAAPEVRP